MENVERGATQVVSGEGKTLWVLGALYEFEATSEDTGGKFALWETTTPPGNPGPPPHIHHNEDEVFYLLEGELELMVEGRTSVVGAGTFVNIPKVTLHTFRNAGTTPARFLGMVAPGGFEGFFEEVGEPASDGSSLTCGSAGRREDHGDRPQVRPRDTAASWRVSSFGDGKTVVLSTPGHQTVTHGVGAFWHPPRPLLSAVAWIIVP